MSAVPVAGTPISAMWKVPFREVYCETFADMARAAFWCHVVIRVFPYAHDYGTDALLSEYREHPATLYEQHAWLIGRAERNRLGAKVRL